MNRILLEAEEVGRDGRVRLTGARAAHVRTVLGAEPGRTVRIGIIDGPTGTGVVAEAAPEGGVVLACEFDPEMPAAGAPVSLVLAMPRPKVMKRLWSVLAQFGLERIAIVNAAKVERAYFDTHWLEPGRVRAAMLDGLQQAGLTRLPEVAVRMRLKPFVEDELDALCPAPVRLAAHPHTERRVGDVVSAAAPGVTLAVGPEGGWTDFELDLLGAHGFAGVGLPTGTLRSDVACVALLAVVRDRLGS